MDFQEVPGMVVTGECLNLFFDGGLEQTFLSMCRLEAMPGMIHA